VGGYDPKTDEAFFDRMDKENRRYEKLHGVEVVRGPFERLSDHLSRARFTQRGDHAVVTDFHMIRVDDIIAKDFARPIPVRMWDYVITFISYVTTGTAFAFLRHAWRFVLYFLYPAVMLFMGTMASLTLAFLVFSPDSTISWLAAAAMFAAAFAAFIHFVAKRYFVLHLFDLWTFSLKFAKRSRQDIEDKLANVCEQARKAFSQDNYDEVLLIGHSTGCSLILDIAGRYVETDHTAQLTVLTVGSTALKIGLHPAAKKMRERVALFVNAPNTAWVEYQSRTDIINFFRTDPARLMGAHVEGKPIRLEIRMKQMVDPQIYRRFKTNFFRGHYQFVFGNTRHHHYDFPDICFGPTPLLERAKAGSAFVAPAFRSASVND